MARSPYGVQYSFGPGGLTPAVKWLIIANVAMFVAVILVPALASPLALTSSQVWEHGWIWQLVTYMFLHAGVFHILFNMLGLWMFGVDLEKMWGTAFFTRFYFVTGIGAGAFTVALSMLPFHVTQAIYHAPIVGASGALFGLLLAYGLYYPDRPIYLYFLFKVPAKYFVMIIGAVSLFSSVTGEGGGLAHLTHLGGLVVAYLYLRGPRLRLNPLAELKYRYLRWKINRMRKRFDVYSGGRADEWDRHIH
jgi:membrane associated rhomboid family serine protease